ncbi:uncharacterized protein BXZ73DRAFT_73182 [Epithele typhae]|uniref:uncharacterized protein n=1 Tax=Epithele typhae TaxID=378194 RepID=UPI002008E46B|nr:uncharacterized protein BXZ73DRAFT_73182 [Epithele typhae]KAH9946428.1 hypothetical protein BXZ73DRAFT_73182 [Epithele typhae]
MGQGMLGYGPCDYRVEVVWHSSAQWECDYKASHLTWMGMRRALAIRSPAFGAWLEKLPFSAVTHALFFNLCEHQPVSPAQPLLLLEPSNMVGKDVLNTGGGYLSDLAMSATLTMSATPITISDLNSLSEPFTPPTHLQSALSVTSDTSHFVLHNKGEATAHPITNNPPTKYLPFQMTMETIRQHKGQCLLCGQKDNLTAMRTILQHGVGTEQLDGLKALPVEYTCDEWTNLMTLCKPHARVYEDNVWWWVPSTALRAHMANLVPISGAATPSHATSEDGEADEMDEGEDSEAHGPYSPSEFISGITIDDGISGQMHNPEIRRSKKKEDAEVQARRVVILAGRVAEGNEDENTDLDVGLR